VTKSPSGSLVSAIFSPDNKSLVTSGGDGLIKFWNLETLKVALTWSTAMGRECLSTFARADNLLASMDANGIVQTLAGCLVRRNFDDNRQLAGVNFL